MLFMTDKLQLTDGQTIIRKYQNEVVITNTGDTPAIVLHSDDGIEWEILTQLQVGNTTRFSEVKRYITLQDSAMRVYITSEIDRGSQSESPTNLDLSKLIEVLQNGIIAPELLERIQKVLTFVEKQMDTDDDGLKDYDEIYTHKTNPSQSDTDGDGLSDGHKIRIGTDPKIPNKDLNEPIFKLNGDNIQMTIPLSWTVDSEQIIYTFADSEQVTYQGGYLITDKTDFVIPVGQLPSEDYVLEVRFKDKDYFYNFSYSSYTVPVPPLPEEPVVPPLNEEPIAEFPEESAIDM